jgi:hypothetical protein
VDKKKGGVAALRGEARVAGGKIYMEGNERSSSVPSFRWRTWRLLMHAVQTRRTIRGQVEEDGPWAEN